MVVWAVLIPAMAAMHKHMHERAEQQDQVGQGTEQVGFVLFPEEEQGDGGKDHQGRPEAPGIAGRWGVMRVMGHVGTLQKTEGRSAMHGVGPAQRGCGF
jgi:hypothetical protein